MASGSKRGTAASNPPPANKASGAPPAPPAPPVVQDEAVVDALPRTDTLPRNDVDIEAELEGAREWAKTNPGFFNHVWLDLEEFETRLDHIVAMLPKEVRRARRICKEEQRITQDAKDEARRLLEEARAEADQIVTTSREEADRLVESSAIRQRALEQAEATIAKAEETAREIRQNSYAYSQQVIGNVVESLKRLTQSVEQDRTQLEQMQPDEE